VSIFRTTGVRCDGCGLFSMDAQGYYVDAADKGGNITSHGRDCPHDFCDACDAKLYPSSSCLKCGIVVDGATAAMILLATKERLLKKGWTPGIGKCLYMTMEEVVADGRWYERDRGPAREALDAFRQIIGEREVTTWNARQTDVAVVLDALDRAIGLLGGVS
jgi:hypothetical protein